ncbi:uncharacterized protein FIESC28_01736 [Fusarium coffeatum]|uniref:Histidine-specific methyltransferase SAM-dependent domain-containing protein n=1 Tax=Fusarium coffeatum TaxID=231269 RepID=A0A366S9A3_9HYPO|nr:uncharacterized protein FIESC28_01736 [Fusarium coffeatum]RBR25498.1 hypothetical protein FIESC28_01736 [Fusarium coffeatum]
MSPSTSATMLWPQANRTVIDIGGSSLNLTFDRQLPDAFRGQGYFPKEMAYTYGMDKWNVIAGTSYQTSDEISIISATAGKVVSDMPKTNNVIVDLGAANSPKFEPYVNAFVNQGKQVTYIALDINKESLTAHINRAADRFPGVSCIGLWGDFSQGDKFYKNIIGNRIFLSLGSIFYNAPDQMCVDRCLEVKAHLSGLDRLIVGQDGPSAGESANTHKAYGTAAYVDFFNTYLAGIQKHAGIVADPKTAWGYESKLINTMHFFEVTALKKMVCQRYGGYVVRKGTKYVMFPSWKRGEEEIHDITNKQGLKIMTLGKSPSSGMRQYLVQPQN